MNFEERLQKLEQKLRRRTRWVLVGFGLAAVVISTMWHHPLFVGDILADTVTAGEFILEDSFGDIHATLGMSHGSAGLTAGLTLFDRNEQGRAGLVLTPHGPALMLSDGNEVRATVVVLDATPIEMLDGQTTEASLLLFGPDGKVVWEASK